MCGGLQVRYAKAIVALPLLLAGACHDIVVPDDLPDAHLLEHYEGYLTARYARSPARFDLFGGELPPGLSLAPDGTVYGTPMGVGSYEFEVRVVDALDRWVLAPLHIAVDHEADQVHVGPILQDADLNGICLDGFVSEAGDTHHYMCMPWVRIAGAGMRGQSQRDLEGGVFWVGPNGAAEGGWFDDVLLRPLPAEELEWEFWAGESWPEDASDGPNSPTDTSVEEGNVLTAGERTGPGQLWVTHQTYGTYTVETMVVAPDFCPAPEGC